MQQFGAFRLIAGITNAYFILGLFLVRIAIGKARCMKSSGQFCPPEYFRNNMTAENIEKFLGIFLHILRVCCFSLHHIFSQSM